MTVVVNASSIRRRLDTLSWPFQLPDVTQFLTSQNIPAQEFVAYLDACIDSGDGVDDAQINGCSPANGAKISAGLKSKGIMV